jgi:hypothetical protein
LTTDTQTPKSFDELEQHFAEENAFDPKEMFNINEIVSVETVAMPERMLKARNIDPDDDAFKALFPEGIPCIDIALRGLDVNYQFDDSGLRHVTVEIVNFQGENAGKPKGQNSHVHVLQESFREVYGNGLFGPENRKALIGRKARWGQHFGKAEFDGQRRTWAWDVPRSILPDDFEWTGDVRTVGRKEDSGATSVGASELSEEAALTQILGIAAGKPTDAGETINTDVLKIPGLPNKYVEAAAGGTLLADLFEESLIDQDNGVIILTSDGEKAKQAGAED